MPHPGGGDPNTALILHPPLPAHTLDQTQEAHRKEKQQGDPELSWVALNGDAIRPHAFGPFPPHTSLLYSEQDGAILEHLPLGRRE